MERSWRGANTQHQWRVPGRADVGGEAGAQQVDRYKGHYGGVEEIEDCNHIGQQRGEPEKAADGAEIHAVEPGGAAMPERQDDGDGGDDDGRADQKGQAPLRPNTTSSSGPRAKPPAMTVA